MPILPVEDTLGGLSLVDPQNIKDNQFESLTNWFYNRNKRLQTRYGVRQYFVDVPDAAVVIDACDSTSGWSAVDDAYGIAGTTAIRGNNALKFSIAIAGSANDDAMIQKSTIVANITNAKGYLGFWLNVPVGFNTNLTDVRIRLGSDSSNYYEWILPTLTMGANRFIKLLYSNATITGAPVDGTITFFRFAVNYNASYLNQADIVIDAIASYSLTALKPVTSYFFFQRDDTLERIAICTAGTNMYRWDETGNAWEIIDTGLSEFETQTGRTTYRTRWDFAVYKNVIYMCNGVDNYRSWNGTLITQYASQPKVRYLRYMGDRVFGTGEDGNPSTLYYTNALAVDAATLSANSVVVGGDELGRANALFELGQFQLVLKSKKIYTVSVAGTGSVTAIDTQNGGYAHRAIANVSNAILYPNDEGIDNLKQKAAATGAAALESKPYTDDLRKLTAQISPQQYNASCGIYISQIGNYYWSFDTGNDNIPETTLVYSALVGKTWSKYLLPAVYDYGFYIDSNGNYVYLATSAQTGIIYRMENGFTDNGRIINFDLKTKAWNFGDPSSWKDFHSVDIFGLKNLGTVAKIEAIVDGEVVYTADLTDDYIDGSLPSVTIASDPIADQPIGGGAVTSEDIELFGYTIRLGGELFASGQTLQIRIYNENDPTVMTLDRLRIRYDENTEDIFLSAHSA